MGVLARPIMFLTGYTPPPPSSPTLVAYTESPQDTTYATSAAITAASSFTWAAGDVIVVAVSAEDGGLVINLTTAYTNLTLTAVSAKAGTAGLTCYGQMFTGVATGAGTGTITATAGTGFSPSSAMVQAWHWTDSGGIGNTVGATEDGTAPSTPTQALTASANSAVVTAWFEYGAAAAGHTGATNTGTFTERLDNQHATRYSQWAGDWINVSAGSANWGTTDGAGLILSFAGTVEVLGP